MRLCLNDIHLLDIVSAAPFRFVAWADTEDDGGAGNAVLTSASKIVKNFNPALTIYPGDMIKCTKSNSCWQAGAADLKKALMADQTMAYLIKFRRYGQS